jgi:CRISPR-associated endoribonuclease Cas6
LRIKINFEAHKKNRLEFPVHYNYLIQGFIYRNLTKKIASRVHNQGFKHGKREFRMFTFSRLFGRFQFKNGNIIYEGRCTLWIASPITEILESFASSLARKGRFKIGKSYCQVTSIEVPFSEDYDTGVLVRTLSPITVYSTLMTGDKHRKTYYYTPFESDFSRLIKDNLLKKYILLNNGKANKRLNFSIIPEKVSKRNEHIIYYKETVVKAWSGIYKLRGSKELIKIAFDCGLGSKNSQGFGMVEKWQPYRKASLRGA